jgi:hypothetical protein
LRLGITTTRGKIIRPQPFLAIKIRSRLYIHNNFNLSSFDEPCPSSPTHVHHATKSPRIGLTITSKRSGSMPD